MVQAKKKLLITTGVFPPAGGGPATYAQLLVKYLASDFQVTVLTYSPVLRERSDANLPGQIIRVWLVWPVLIRRLIYSLRVIKLAWQSDRILVLNVFDGGLPLLLLRRPFFVRISGDRVWEAAVRRKQTAVTIDDFQTIEKPFKLSLLSKWQTHICRQAAGVIAHSRYLAKLAEGWGVPAKNITMIYSGSEFTPAILSREE